MSKFAATKYTYSFLHAKTQKSKALTLWFVIFVIKNKKTSKANSKTAKLQILQKEGKKERASKCKNDLTIVDGDISCIYF